MLSAARTPVNQDQESSVVVIVDWVTGSPTASMNAPRAYKAAAGAAAKLTPARLPATEAQRYRLPGNGDMAKPIRFDTENLWWVVTLGHDGRHTTATVRGQPHVVAQPAGDEIKPGRHENFNDADTDQDALIARIKVKIEQLDGPICSTDSDGV